MATYNSIHLETDDREAVRLVLGKYLFRREWWKFRGRGGYDVREPVDGWTEITMARSCTSARKLTEYLSRELSCVALSLGYQSTAGHEYVRLCNSGITLRVLWFAPGEDAPYEEQGKLLGFEEEYTRKRRAEAQAEMAEMSAELRTDSAWMLKPTSHLPGCSEFAEALGCRSFDR